MVKLYVERVSIPTVKFTFNVDLDCFWCSFMVEIIIFGKGLRVELVWGED